MSTLKADHQNMSTGPLVDLFSPVSRANRSGFKRKTEIIRHSLGHDSTGLSDPSVQVGSTNTHPQTICKGKPHVIDSSPSQHEPCRSTDDMPFKHARADHADKDKATHYCETCFLRHQTAPTANGDDDNVVPQDDFVYTSLSRHEVYH